jgi:hypothetical protein
MFSNVFVKGRRDLFDFDRYDVLYCGHKRDGGVDLAFSVVHTLIEFEGFGLVWVRLV